jgi:hypothetical protein
MKLYSGRRGRLLSLKYTYNIKNMKQLSLNLALLLALTLAFIGCQEEDFTSVEDAPTDGLVESRSEGKLTALWDDGWALDINARGQVVGLQYYPDDYYRYKAVMWYKGVLTTLWEDGAAKRINNRGQIIGYGTDSKGHSGTLVWDKGVITELSDFWGVENINEPGQIVGYAGNLSESLYPIRPILWDKGVITELWGEGEAHDVNGQGEVVGSRNYRSVYTGTHGSPVIWINGQTMYLGGPGAALAINNERRIVGYQYKNSRSVAMLWGSGGTKELWDDGQAWDINERGQVVGYKNAVGAVLWEEGELINLWPGYAHAINARGQVVGEIYNGGVLGVNAVLWERK